MAVSRRGDSHLAAARRIWSSSAPAADPARVLATRSRHLAARNSASLCRASPGPWPTADSCRSARACARLLSLAQSICDALRATSLLLLPATPCSSRMHSRAKRPTVNTCVTSFLTSIASSRPRCSTGRLSERKLRSQSLGRADPVPSSSSPAMAAATSRRLKNGPIGRMHTSAAVTYATRSGSIIASCATATDPTFSSPI